MEAASPLLLAVQDPILVRQELVEGEEWDPAESDLADP